MIVKITQTASNIKQLFYIDSDDFNFHGELGSWDKYQSISLSNEESVIKGVHRFSNWVNYIPLRYLFGYTNITRVFDLYRNENKYGNIVFSEHGFHKSYYLIQLDNGPVFHCYSRSKGSFNYVSIYEKDKQIALIETLLNVEDFKYTHKLYILNDYKQFADTLSFFVLYYANFKFSQRFHMSSGSQNVKAWSFSRYNYKYDPEWREKNFPNENYFGKTSIFT